MKNDDSVSVKGKVTLRTFTEDKRDDETIWEFHERMEREGKIVAQETKNLVTTIGKNWIADRLIGNSNAYQNDTTSGLMAFGVGSTAATAGDSMLVEEAWRNTLTSSTRSNNIATFATFMPKTGSNSGGALVPNGSSLTEVAMFVKGVTVAGSVVSPSFTKDTGAMINRGVFAAISKTSTVSLTAEIDWTIS